MKKEPTQKQSLGITLFLWQQTIQVAIARQLEKNENEDPN